VLEAKGVDAKGVKCQAQPWFATQFPRSETKVWLLFGPWALWFANTKNASVVCSRTGLIP